MHKSTFPQFFLSKGIFWAVESRTFGVWRQKQASPKAGKLKKMRFYPKR
jgi:hypothetical protein